PFSSTITAQTAKVDGVRAVSPVRNVAATVDDGQLFTVAIDPTTFADVEKIEATAGSTDIDEDSVMLSMNHRTGREVGDTVEVTIGETTRDLTVAGFFDELGTFGTPDVLFSIDTIDAMGGQGGDNVAFVFLEDGADRDA